MYCKNEMGETPVHDNGRLSCVLKKALNKYCTFAMTLEENRETDQQTQLHLKPEAHRCVWEEQSRKAISSIDANPPNTLYYLWNLVVAFHHTNSHIKAIQVAGETVELGESSWAKGQGMFPHPQ